MPGRQYVDSDFAQPKAACDVIMKGGITSGVVYPWAITELAKHYRFSNIGGTSAGAIAAAATAAAEFGRSIKGKGFVRLAALPQDAGENLLRLFQPSPKLKPLFRILLAVLNAKSTLGKVISGAVAAISGYIESALLWTLPGLAIALVALFWGAVGFVLFGALLALVLAVAGVILALKKTVFEDLPANNFGMCPGIRQPGYTKPGFTDWIADVIDDAAGRDIARDPPLTFGDLAPPDGGAIPGGRPTINLKMMTTNLMLRRPYSLPLDDDTFNIFKFKRADFEKLFSPRIMEQLLARCAPFSPTCGEEGEYYTFPKAHDLPIVVAVRMSLSLPLLINTVPLYACDSTLAKEADKKRLQLCLFSDGGLSSNFPIHFFDRLLPDKPTFGISLDDYDVKRDRLKNPPDKPSNEPSPIPVIPNQDGESRVWMPDPKRETGGLLIPIQPFSGLVGFAMRLIDAAKDWQDNLQSTLAGYRERIVRVYLKPDEGGLNITMPDTLTAELAEYGAQAGDLLRDHFDLDEHRWRRFLVAMDRMDETLATFSGAFKQKPDGPQPYKDFLENYPAKPPLTSPPLSYPQKPAELDTLRARLADLAALGDEWSAQSADEKTTAVENVPRPDSDLRITPKP